MAGVSTKEIKTRIRSMESTRQITKAMEMVASSKLRKAQAQATASRPYFETLYGTIQDIVNCGADVSSPYMTVRTEKNVAYIMISGDRGLAGGYNNNVLKLTLSQAEGKNAVYMPIGKKGLDYFRAHGQVMITESYNQAEDVSVGDCFTIAKQLCKQFLKGELDGVYVVYTKFESVLSQVPECLQLLPLRNAETKPEKPQQILYEPDCETVLGAIIPEYLGGVLYGALCESRASEQAARRTAMDAATQNADEMIGELSLQFNRARQAAITQEITEIIAGA